MNTVVLIDSEIEKAKSLVAALQNKRSSAVKIAKQESIRNRPRADYQVGDVIEFRYNGIRVENYRILVNKISYHDSLRSYCYVGFVLRGSRLTGALASSLRPTMFITGDRIAEGLCLIARRGNISIEIK